MRLLRAKLTREWMLAGLAALLWGYYLTAFAWLERRAASADPSLDAEWKRLALRSVEAKPNGRVDLPGLTNRMDTLRESDRKVLETLQLIRTRCKLEPDVIREFENPFQLVDFENARESRAESLRARAKVKQVTLATNVLEGLPRFTPELENPSLLWPRLSMASHFLATAIELKVDRILGFDANLGLLPSAVPFPATSGVEELSAKLRVAGSFEVLQQLLHTLPYTGTEAASAGISGIGTNKPAMFLRGLVIRRETGTKPDEVTMEVTVGTAFFGKQ